MVAICLLEIETTDGSNLLPVPPPLVSRRGEENPEVEMQINVKMKGPDMPQSHESLSTIAEEEVIPQ
jgi:hypothetical protein